ncbi:MAG: hypothetical protein ACR2I5_01240 [Candidatus Limnocylindria bacterium]
MTSRRPELVPRAVRQAVEDTVGGWGLYTKGQIADLFRNEGFARDENYVGAGGERKQMAGSFHAAIDFSSASEVDRYLRVVEQVLDDHDTDSERATRDRLIRVMRRSGIDLDERGRLKLTAPRSLG